MALIQDLKAYSGGSFLKSLATIIFNQGFHIVCLYRFSHLFANKGVFSVFGRLIQNITRILYGAEIDYRAHFAAGFQVIHGTGIVIGEFVQSKGPLRIYQGVTIGNGGTFGSKKKLYNGTMIQQPIFEPNVVVFANAMVLGPIIIGEGSYIGAATLVTKDVASNQVVFNEKKLLTKERS